jgi:hypothetical protein
VLNQKWLPACAGMTDFFVMYGEKSISFLYIAAGARSDMMALIL